MKKSLVTSLLLLLFVCTGWSEGTPDIRTDLIKVKRQLFLISEIEATYQKKETELKQNRKSEYETAAAYAAKIQGEVDKLAIERELVLKPLQEELNGYLEKRYIMPWDMFEATLGAYDAENHVFILNIDILNNGNKIDDVKFDVDVPNSMAAQFSHIFAAIDKTLLCSLQVENIRGNRCPWGKYELLFPGLDSAKVSLHREEAEAQEPKPKAEASPNAAPATQAKVVATPTSVPPVPQDNAALSDFGQIEAALKVASPAALKKIDARALGIDKLSPSQKSELQGRLKKNNAGGIMFLNMLLPIGIGSMIQGNVGYGLYHMASTLLAFVIGLETEASGAGILFMANGVAAYIGGMIAPYVYQNNYNTGISNLLK